MLEVGRWWCLVVADDVCRRSFDDGYEVGSRMSYEELWC